MKLNYIFYLFALLFSHSLRGFQIDNLVPGVPMTKVQLKCGSVKKFFKKNQQPSFEHCHILTNPVDLLQVAKDTLKYFNHNYENRRDFLDPVGFRNVLSAEKVKNTLNFVISTIEDDVRDGVKPRILDYEFLKENFKFIKWLPDDKTSKKSNVYTPLNGNIRLTYYSIFCVNGHSKKEGKYSCALYALKDESIRAKYTKQEIIAGALELPCNKKKVAPIAWVSRDALEKAQGMTIVKMPDCSYKILNIYKHNGFDYDKTIKGSKQQKRYWFFKESAQSQEAIQSLKNKILSRKNVIFSGDIYNIGLGKLIAIKYQNPLTSEDEFRLGVLADTGGAFFNNLYQLDMFAGIFSSKKKLAAHRKNIPDTAEAYILYKA